MSMKSSLVSYLRSQAAVTALVGQRVRLSQAEQSDGSRVIINQITGDDKEHMLAATGKTIATFQINCDELSPIKADALAAAVRSVLHGYRGTMGDVQVSMCHLDQERDSTEPPIEGFHRGIYSVQQDYLIGWTVSIPTFS